MRGVQQHLVRRRRPRRPRSANSMSSLIGVRLPARRARCASSAIRTPVVGSSLTTSWFGSGTARPSSSKPSSRRMLEDEPELGLRHRQALAGADEERHARPAPVLDVQAQRGVRLGGRVRRDAVDRQVAVVLAADVVGRVGVVDRAQERDLRVLDRLRIAAARAPPSRRRRRPASGG